MNRLEQRFHDAAPPIPPAVFPLDVKTELEMIPHRADGVELVAANRRSPGTTGINTKPRALALLLAILVGAAMWVTALANQSPRTTGAAEDAESLPGLSGVDSGAGTLPRQTSTAYSFWRTVVVSRPWTDAPAEVTASIEMPAEWKVLRHIVSPSHPGLHFTVLDQDSLPVAMFYYGPVPAAVACRPHYAQQAELERIAMKSGAELLDPSVAKVFSYSVSAGPEPRSSFELVPPSPHEGHCGPQLNTSDPPVVVLDFGDILSLRTPQGSGPSPRSSYARSFPSQDDAGRYMKSAEYGALKRMITSLRFSFPAGMSPSWQVPESPLRGPL